jgi:hypothetical protein
LICVSRDAASPELRLEIERGQPVPRTLDIAVSASGRACRWNDGTPVQHGLDGSQWIAHHRGNGVKHVLIVAAGMAAIAARMSV